MGDDGGVMILGATFNAAYYLVQKLLGSEHHMSIDLAAHARVALRRNSAICALL